MVHTPEKNLVRIIAVAAGVTEIIRCLIQIIRSISVCGNIRIAVIRRSLQEACSTAENGALHH